MNKENLICRKKDIYLYNRFRQLISVKMRIYNGVDVDVGGSGGDEGKGITAAYLASTKNYSILLRNPSPQAGHSLPNKNGEKIALATLPCGVMSNDHSRILLGAGSLINVSKFFNEIEKTNIDSRRIGIDYQAAIVTPEHIEEERGNENLMKGVGSVGSGVGPCRRDRIMRVKGFQLARDIPELKPFLTDAVGEIYSTLEKGETILLEGDHGFKLSLIHGEYPKVTSRDTTTSGFLSEAGINPFTIRDVYMCIKPYVTRVGPGPLEDEIFDEGVLEWAHNEGGEKGSVSKRLRRIGKLERENILRASRINGATKICVTHMDAFKNENFRKVFGEPEEFLSQIEKEICSKYPYPKIDLLSYGPKIEDIVEYPRPEIDLLKMTEGLNDFIGKIMSLK